MIKTAFLIVLSFFAVLGVFETIVTFIESISMAKYNHIKDVALTVKLSGNIKDITFLLNSLVLHAQRLCYKNVTPRVVIKNDGLEETTYDKIYLFCLENDNITIENI